MNKLPEVQKTRFSVAISTAEYQDLIKSTLNDPARARSFTASITSAVAISPALQECQSSSIIAGALLGESLNLSPSPQLGQYYLVPFETAVKDANGKKIYFYDENGKHLVDSKGNWLYKTVKRASFVLGYKGYLQLAIRTGFYKGINTTEIKEGEYLGRDKFNGQPMFSFIEDDDEREKMPTIGYMAYFEYLNGFTKAIYWSRDKVMSHADRYSAAFSAEAYKKLQNNEIPDNERWKYSSFWYSDFDAMAKKTMLRQLIGKWGVMTANSPVVQAYASDNHVIQATDGLLTPLPDVTDDGTPDELPEPTDETTPQEPESAPAPQEKTTTPPKQPKKINLKDL